MRRVIRANNTSPLSLSSTMEGSVVDRKITVEPEQPRGTVRRASDEFQDERVDDDASRHQEKRLKTTHDFSVNAVSVVEDCDERSDCESVEDVRSRMLGLLQTRMMSKKDNTTDGIDTTRLHTLENILFKTAESLEEYKDEETLDDRLKTLLRALLERKLRLAAKARLLE